MCFICDSLLFIPNSGVIYLTTLTVVRRIDTNDDEFALAQSAEGHQAARTTPGYRGIEDPRFMRPEQLQNSNLQTVDPTALGDEERRTPRFHSVTI